MDIRDPAISEAILRRRWIACISDDSEHALARALRIDRHEVTHPDAAPPGNVAANDVIDIACVDVASWIGFILISISVKAV